MRGVKCAQPERKATIRSIPMTTAHGRQVYTHMPILVYSMHTHTHTHTYMHTCIHHVTLAWPIIVLNSSTYSHSKASALLCPIYVYKMYHDRSVVYMYTMKFTFRMYVYICSLTSQCYTRKLNEGFGEGLCDSPALLVGQPGVCRCVCACVCVCARACVCVCVRVCRCV